MSAPQQSKRLRWRLGCAKTIPMYFWHCYGIKALQRAMYRVIFIIRLNRIWQAKKGQRDGLRVIGTPLISLTNILPPTPMSTSPLGVTMPMRRQCAGCAQVAVTSDCIVKSWYLQAPSTYRSLTRSLQRSSNLPLLIHHYLLNHYLLKRNNHDLLCGYPTQRRDDFRQ